MTVLQSIILGIVQGIAEFFPISSSAHLIFIRFLFNFGENLSSSEWMVIDIALHFGTLLAIVIYFYKDFLIMFKEGFKLFKKGKPYVKNLSSEGRLFWYIVIASIPGALAGVLFDDLVEEFVRENIIIIASSLAIMGVMLFIIDKKSKGITDIESISLKQAFLIGIGQAFSIIPGFSRSGTTMMVARIVGLKREVAAKFSFLLGAPIVLGATIISLKDLSLEIINFPFILGVLVSFLVGMFAIKSLMEIVHKKGFEIFAIYRIVLAIFIITMYIIRG